jgi:hypothetical protein
VEEEQMFAKIFEEEMAAAAQDEEHMLRRWLPPPKTRSYASGDSRLHNASTIA